jgi:hypothetical protein
MNGIEGVVDGPLRPNSLLPVLINLNDDRKVVALRPENLRMLPDARAGVEEGVDEGAGSDGMAVGHVTSTSAKASTGTIAGSRDAPGESASTSAPAPQIFSLSAASLAAHDEAAGSISLEEAAALGVPKSLFQGNELAKLRMMAEDLGLES